MSLSLKIFSLFLMAKQAFTEVIVEEMLYVGSDDSITTSLELVTLEVLVVKDELVELAVSFCLKKKLIQLFVGGGGSLFRNFYFSESLESLQALFALLINVDRLSNISFLSIHFLFMNFL